MVREKKVCGGWMVERGRGGKMCIGCVDVWWNGEERVKRQNRLWQ